MVCCKECGKELSADFGEMPRKPYPACGSLVRSFDAPLNSGEFQMTGHKGSLAHGTFGVQSKGQRDDQGLIVHTAIGPPPKNEEDSLEACARLVGLARSRATNSGNQ